MKFTLYDHAGKGIYLRQQLLDAGHQEAENIEELDALILDCDWPWAYPRPNMIEAAVEHGAKVVLYPHGGRPTAFVYDGIAKHDKRVHLRLEHGPGSIDLTSMFTNQDLRQHATGWLYSPTADFQPVEKPTRILFAPLHPNIEAIQKGTNGHDPAPAHNQDIYRRLLELPNVEIVVSLVGPPWRSGLWQHPRATFAHNPNMVFHHSFEQILSADVVVAAGTMLAASVALGKPTVGFCQGIFVDYIDGAYVQAAHQDLYRDMVRYPLDAEDGPLSALIEQACAVEQTEWRANWIGQDGTDTAIKLIEELVGHPAVKAQSDVVITGATAKAMVRS